MATVIAAVLEPVGQARVALVSVDIQASLRGLLSDVAVTHVYRNLEDVNIEAVYTFPLPLDSVLLDLSLELNGKTLRGVVQPKSDAEERYEDAIVDGDSAILLQQVEPGVFTLNVGNILPNEQAVVRFRYGQLHRWQGSDLRFHLPTTVAPRYGDPALSDMAPHQIPEYALTAHHGFSLSLQIEGELGQADFECPSHPVAVSQEYGMRKIALSGGSALMDRDFVVVFKEPEGQGIEGQWVQDGEGYVALASFHPSFSNEDASPRCVKLVIDCSGSMGGDSIAQARIALHEILSLLKPCDYFNLTRFGSSHRMLFPEAAIASTENVQAAAGFVAEMDADMGGTEISSALNATFRAGGVERLPSDVLLITDGEVWGFESIVDEAKKSGHRIFTVGVGSAVSEAFVRGVAEATGGACELVSPREDMAQRIIRHFQRIDQPMATSVEFIWPSQITRQNPERFMSLYSGDTLHVLGWSDYRPAGEVVLKVGLASGQEFTQRVYLTRKPTIEGEPIDCLARIAAFQRLSTMGVKEATDIALEYNLVTKDTSYVLVYERDEDEKSDEVPAVRKVPQVLAAGWGGMGQVRGHMDMAVEACRSKLAPNASRVIDASVDEDFAMLDIPAFLRRQTDSFEQLVSVLNDRYPDSTSSKLDIQTISELVVLGLDEEVGEDLLALTTNTVSERHVAVVFLTLLSASEHGIALSRHVKRLIRMADKEFAQSASLVQAVGNILGDQ